MQVSFYLLQTDNNVHNFTCRLLSKIYQQGHEAYVYMKNEQDVKTVNDLLWTFKDTSFVPHAIDQNISAPIYIGTDKKPAANAEILVNLTDIVPNFYENYTRVVEIVANDENLKQLARKKYKWYKKQGWEILNFKF